MLSDLLPKLSTPRLFTTILILVLASVVWFLPEILQIDRGVSNYPMVFMDQFVLFSLSAFWAHVIQYVVMVVLLWYITRFCETLQIIPVRTMMPFFIGVIVFSSVSFLQYFTSSTISFVLFVLAIAELMRMYSTNQLAFSAFNIFFFVTVAGLFTYEYLFLLPLFLLGMVILRSFSLRTLLASLFGIASVLILLVSFCYLFDAMLKIEYLWQVPRIYTFSRLAALPRSGLFYGAFLLVVTLWSIVSYLMTSLNYKLIVRFNFLFIHWSFWISLIALILFAYHFQLLLFVPICFIILLLSLYFATNSTRLSSIAFLVFLFFTIFYRIVSLFGF